MKLTLSILLAAIMTSMASAKDYGYGKKDKMKDKNVSAISIEFAPGQHELTADQKQQIMSFVQGANQIQGDLNIGIAAWSDQPFPATRKQDLSKNQKDLAKKRLEQVENYVEDVADFKGDVDTYNMAERANWLARVFETEGAEIKSIFSKQDETVSDDVLREKYQTYKRHGDARKVVLVLTVNDRTRAIPPGLEGPEDEVL